MTNDTTRDLIEGPDNSTLCCDLCGDERPVGELRRSTLEGGRVLLCNDDGCEQHRRALEAKYAEAMHGDPDPGAFGYWPGEDAPLNHEQRLWARY
jgi:hypothetical protein